MSAQRIAHITKRAKNYKEMGTLPDELQQLLSNYYIEDVGFLLDEISRLQNEQRTFARIITGQDTTIDNLKADKKAMACRLKQVIEKYDWYADVFSPPRVVKQPSRKTRVTDNQH